MAGRAEELYNELQNAAAMIALIGTSEDSHFDCKEWPAKDDDAQKMLAKAYWETHPAGRRQGYRRNFGDHARRNI